MKTQSSLTLLAIMTLGFVSCTITPHGTQDRQALGTVRTETADEKIVAKELVALTNQYRKGLGVEVLSPDHLLKGLAMEHSVFLSYNHDGNANLAEIAHAGVYQRSDVALSQNHKEFSENVVWAQTDRGEAAYKLFHTLINSESHRKAIEASSWDHMGISVVKKNGAYYATQLFSDTI